MKLLMIAALISFLLIVLLLTACDSLLQSKDVRNFMPGVYTRHYKDEYTESDDTIAIHEKGATYEVTKRSRQVKIIDGKPLEPHYILVKWTGVYNAEQKHLWVEPAAKAILFDADKKELSIGTQPYKKAE